MRKTGLAAVVCLTGLMVCGCSVIPNPLPFRFSDEGEYLPPKVGPGLVPRQPSPIPDLSIPIGFKPVVSKSSSSFDGRTRRLRHLYQGMGAKDEAVSFYRRQAVWHGWYEPMVDVDGDHTVLSTTKGPEELNIRIRERRAVITIVIEITPLKP